MSEGGGLLNLDPAVLFLQVVAFVVLFLLLRRFLFGPLLNAMSQREQEIAEGLDAGERAKAEMARIDEERQQMLDDAREAGREQVRKAVKEAEQVKDRIVAEARDEAQQIRQRAKESVELEREETMLQLRHDVVDLALLAARRAVLTPLDEQKHREAIDDFIATLEQER